MTLTDVTKNLKRFLPLIILFLFALVIVGLVLRPRPEKKPSQLPPLQISTTSTSTQPQVFDFSSLPKIEVPKKLGVYTIGINKFGKEFATGLATKLGFGAEPTQILQTTTGVLYSWSDEKSSLDVSEQLARYNIFWGNLSDLAPLLDEEAVKASAINFLTEIGVLDQLTINPQQTRYFKIESGQLIPTRKEGATIVQFSFQQTIDGVPVVGQDPSLGQIIVRVDGAGKILFFQIVAPINYTKLTDFPLKNFDQATSELRLGQGIIVSATKTINGDLVEVTEQPGFSITKSSIKKAYLAYYYPIPAPELIQPIFVFEGDFVDIKGQVGVLTLYLPAIANQ